MNSSPYPHIPASYYVALNRSKTINIFVFDADGNASFCRSVTIALFSLNAEDEIMCESYKEDSSGFLTVLVDHRCALSYKHDRPGKQFGQFWLMDRHQNRALSRSLISIQVHVLETPVCDDQPELIVENQKDRRKAIVVHLNESIDIATRLTLHCPLVEPRDQTITEITTLCTNHQPTVSTDGGIEVLFTCAFHRCKKHPLCFVGEIGLKLPATDVTCVLISVIGTGTPTSEWSSSPSLPFVKRMNAFERRPTTVPTSSTTDPSSSHHRRKRPNLRVDPCRSVDSELGFGFLLHFSHCFWPL